MAQVSHQCQCPECGTNVPLAAANAQSDIKCPQCGVWFALPPRLRESEDGYTPDEGRSNVGLWIGLGIGGGVLVLLVVCGGVGAYFWNMTKQRRQARQAEMQARVAFQGQRPPVFVQPHIIPQFAPPTEFPPQTEDYAEARKKFQTKLVIEMPAPQGVDPFNVPADANEIEYVSGELHLKAWVNRDPGDNQKRPAVLFLHDGFAFGLDDWLMAQSFRDAGYVTLIPMLRGENGLPGSYSLFYNEVNDALAAADALEKLPYVDSKRLYVAGHSNGGTLAMLVAMTSGRFRAAASFSGSPDQMNWTVTRSNMSGYGGTQEGVPYDTQNKKESHMRSPLAFPESFKCPTRLYFGNQEQYFKATNQKLAELAKKKKRDVDAVEVHGDQLTAVYQAMPHCIEFFRQHSAESKKNKEEHEKPKAEKANKK
jgi:dienelactone hydrolase